MHATNRIKFVGTFKISEDNLLQLLSVPALLNQSQSVIDKSKGYAGDVHQIASSVPDVSTGILNEFDLGGQDSSSLIDFSNVNDFNFSSDVHEKSYAEEIPQESQLTAAVAEDNNWDLLNDLSADPLGDDSLDAFINLDKYLMGNSFLGEESNELVKQAEPVEVNPVISIPSFVEDLAQAPVVDFLEESFDAVFPNLDEMVQSSPFKITTIVGEPTPIEHPTRKRKKVTKVNHWEQPNLFEIPQSTKALLKSVVKDRKLEDHDYSAKRQKLDSLDDDCQPSTSGSQSLPCVLTEVEQIDDLISSTTNTGPLDKQSIRRIKNNVASKRSREQRKQKHIEMDKEAEELIVKNEALRKKIVELEAMAKEMKAKLVAKMAGK